jgi:hypothetical protein
MPMHFMHNIAMTMLYNAMDMTDTIFLNGEHDVIWAQSTIPNWEKWNLTQINPYPCEYTSDLASIVPKKQLQGRTNVGEAK